MIASQKSIDHDEDNDRRKHGQIQFTNTEDRKLKRVNTKAEQKPDMKSCIPAILAPLAATVVLPSKNVAIFYEREIRCSIRVCI